MLKFAKIFNVDKIMDELDLKIIRILSDNADVTATEIKKQINLSIPAINKRIQNLKQSGVINNFTIVTNGKKAGKPVTAYIFAILESSEYMDSLLEYVSTDDDILECATITGEYDCLLKICAKNIEELDQKLGFLKKHKGIAKTNTMLSLTSHKYTATIMPCVNK